MENTLSVNSLADSLVYMTLSQATSQDARILKPAEQKLSEWETHAGFYSSLCKIISNKQVEVSIRWLATVCLKNGVDKYWRKAAPNAISDDEKSVIRAELTKCFNETTDAIASQLAVLVAKISRMDWPRDWPDIIDILVNNVKSNEDEVKRYRSLLILSHVVKTLSTKRLIGDRRLFYELSANLFPIMFEFWNYVTNAFLSADAEMRKSVKFRCDLEMALLSAKILSKLTVYGFNKADSSAQAMNFMKMIFERTKTLLQFRLTLTVEEGRYKELVEKQTLTLMKVLFSVLETQPFFYTDLVGATLQYSFYFCFTAEGIELLFDTILIRWLNLMKAILICHEYNARGLALEEIDDSVHQVRRARNEFFRPVIVQEIFFKLVNEYLVLNKKDLTAWDADPEAYAAEEIGESWKYNLKPCIEGLFSAFLDQYREILIPLVVNVIEKNKSSPNPNDMVAILKKDAVYNVFGLSVFELYDEIIDFDKWFTDILIPELHVKSPFYRILRRRIAWLIGRWAGVKLSPSLHPMMYSEIINLLEPSEDIAVRLTAANTIKDVVDDFEFRSKVFLDFIPRCFQLLYTLLEQSKECETKMQVLTLLSFIIERVGWEIAPFFDSLVNYLPLLWQHSSGHNMLRCAIVSVLTQLVRGLGDQCFTLEKFVIMVVECSLDTKEEGHVYLLEDGLHLLMAYIDNIVCSDEILSVFHYLPPLIEKSTEHLKIIISIINGMLILSPDKFLQLNGVCIVKLLMDLLPDMKSEGVAIILEFFELCMRVRPYHSVELLSDFLQDLLVNINVNDEKASVVAIRLSILARIILISKDLFAQMIESTSKLHNISQDILFTNFLDYWLQKVQMVWPPERRKLVGVALTNLLTAGSNIILTRFSQIFSAVVEVMNDIMINDEGDTYTDSLYYTDDTSVINSENEEQEPKTGQETRLSEITLNDAIHKVDFPWYFQNQLEELRIQIGDVNFQQLMDTVTTDNLNLMKTYLKKR